MTRVLHTGDTHIGYRQYNSPERRSDFLDAFRRVVKDAIADDVDAVVHAGDLFHDRQPGLADIHGTIEVLRDLRDADIPLYAIVGNHERTRDQQWLDLFETLGLATRLGRSPHEVGGVALYGLDFVPRSRRTEINYEFAPHDADHAALVAHGLFEPFAHADWETETVLESANIDFDAMLLGDNHDPGVETVAETWVTYCGSTERTDITEREARGYNIVTFDGDVTIARRGIETRPFVPIDLELAPNEGIDRIRDRLREESLEDAVVVVSITGDGEPISPAEIETFATERDALIARVTDRRQFEAGDIPEVRFADPDRAVRDRLRELGLSDAGLAIDELIRDDTLAKTNVREAVEDRVRELIADDPAAFEPAVPTESTRASVAGSNESDENSSPSNPTDRKSDTSRRRGAESGGELSDPSDSTTSAGASGSTHDVEREPEDAEADKSTPDPSGDGQATMEEYF